MTRTEKLLTITKRLIIMTSSGLLLVVAIFALTVLRGNRLMVSWACFGCGLVGGFVSIQQRLKKFGDEELDLLSTSWFQILLIPVYGGIFALVLYLCFLSKIIEGPSFRNLPVCRSLNRFRLRRILETISRKHIPLLAPIWRSSCSGHS